MNHSLLPLSYLPRKKAGEKIRKEAIFSQGVERNGNAATEDRAFFNTLPGIADGNQGSRAGTSIGGAQFF